MHYLAFSSTGRTRLWFRAWFCTCSMTSRTFILQIEFKLFVYAKARFLQCNPDLGAHIRSSYGSVRISPAASASKQIAENIPKDIPHIHSRKIKSTGACAAIFKSSVPKLVILSSFICITQYGICLRSLFKLHFCIFISRVRVGMVFLRQLSVCFFQLSVIGIFAYA